MENKMSTRSLIAIEKSDGAYDAIYCHYDGYVKNGVGEELFRNYKDLLKVDDLISLGNRRHLVNTKLEDELYNEDYVTYKNLDELKEELDMIDYIYIFNWDNEWEVLSYDNEAKKLSDIFKGE